MTILATLKNQSDFRQPQHSSQNYIKRPNKEYRKYGILLLPKTVNTMNMMLQPPRSNTIGSSTSFS